MGWSALPWARRILCVGYAAAAVLALVGTWSQNVAYLGGAEGSFAGRFLIDTLANPASTSITVDLLILLIPLFAWMVIEGRRIGIRFYWLYPLFGMLVAISVTFPLYLIARELRLAERGEAEAPLGLTALDLAVLILFSAGVAGATLYTLAR
jgi:hypothetical protein